MVIIASEISYRLLSGAVKDANVASADKYQLTWRRGSGRVITIAISIIV